MKPVERSELVDYVTYEEGREEYRRRILVEKASRRIHVGPHLTFLFETRETIRYQAQEMLRIERIFESEGIAAELDAYNPLVPDGSNWKATLLLEFPDVEQRREALTKLKGIEGRCWVQVEGHARVFRLRCRA